jgi:hypothetical protein
VTGGSGSAAHSRCGVCYIARCKGSGGHKESRQAHVGQEGLPRPRTWA